MSVRMCVRKCGRRLGNFNRSGLCKECQKSYRAICALCGKVVPPSNRGRRCGQCIADLERFRSAWESYGAPIAPPPCPEEIERRIRLYAERAAQGLNLFTGGVVKHDRN